MRCDPPNRTGASRGTSSDATDQNSAAFNPAGGSPYTNLYDPANSFACQVAIPNAMDICKRKWLKKWRLLAKT
jgi:hypothetical protein